MPILLLEAFMPDYLRYYDLEKYLFDDLSVRYRALQGRGGY